MLTISIIISLPAYDCGMYVVCITEELCKQLEDDTKCDAQVSVSGDFVTQKRKDIKKLIDNLRKI